MKDDFVLNRGYRIALQRVLSGIELCLMTPKNHDEVCELLNGALSVLAKTTKEIELDH